MGLPYTSLQLFWIIFQTLNQVEQKSMQGQKCSRNLVAANPPLERAIAPQGGFLCMPLIMDMECVLEKH